jgi:cell division protein FtsW
MRTWDQAAHRVEVDFDAVFFITTAALAVMGTVMVFSSSYFVSKEIYSSGLAMTARHAAHMALGIVAMFALMAIDYRILSDRRIVFGALVLGVASLVCCFMPVIGHSGGHSRRWVGFGPMVFQASEAAKISLVIFFSHHLSRKSGLMGDFAKGPLPVLIIVSIVCALIFFEPDFGTAATIGMWTLAMLFMGGMAPRHLLILIGSCVPVGLWGLLSEPYRRARITAFLDPWRDPLDTGYQLIQSMVAFANGGVFGSGLGEGSQKLFYLPAPHTDFILSVVGEEAGFLGVLTVAFLFALWIRRGFSIALATNDSFGYYMVLSSVTLIGIQAVLNMGVALCLLPTKGLPLPFFSYGGSTIVSTLFLCGLVLSVSRRARL